MNLKILETWLNIQCQGIPQVKVAWVSLTPLTGNNKGFSVTWPTNYINNPTLSSLISLAKNTQGTLIKGPTPLSKDDSKTLVIAQPFEIKSRAKGIIAVEVVGKHAENQREILCALQLGQLWLQELLDGQLLSNSHPLGMEILNTLLNVPTFLQSSMALVCSLANHFECDRVSFLRCQGTSFKLIAVSNRSVFSKHSEYVSQIEDVIIEAKKSGQPIFWDSSRHSDLLTAHAKLAGNSSKSIITFLIDIKGRSFGALCFENGPQFLNDEEKKGFIKLCSPLVELLALKYENERSLISIGKFRILNFIQRLTAEMKWTQYAFVLSIIMLAAFIIFGKTNYRVKGEAHVQGEQLQAIIAPFDGYVMQAYTKAGEVVDSHFVMATLDDKDFKFELDTLVNNKIELNKEHRKALAQFDRSTTRIIKSRIEQVNAKIGLLTQKIKRTQLKANFTGIVVSGDLSRQLGKPVEKGEVLFEIAPLNQYRVVIEVLDKDIPNIKIGQKGHLVLRSMSSKKIPIQVNNITSIRNENSELGKFKVDARLIQPFDSLRPGMRGIAKIDVGQKSRIWIWSHDLIKWFRFKLWKWIP